MTKEVVDTMLEKMNKSVAVYKKELTSMRAGRANPQLLDRILVDYYGTPTPINQVANVSIPDPRIIQIAPWEQSMLKAIEKAIQKSDLGINPSNDGKVIRLLMPELTEERRKDLVKQTRHPLDPPRGQRPDQKDEKGQSHYRRRAEDHRG